MSEYFGEFLRIDVCLSSEIHLRDFCLLDEWSGETHSQDVLRVSIQSKLVAKLMGCSEDGQRNDCQ